MELAQTGDYPYSDTVEMSVKAAIPVAFTLHLRIPAWAENARLLVNGKPAPLIVTTGFAQISRTWQTGDTIALELPSRPRLQSIDQANPQVAAVLQGAAGAVCEDPYAAADHPKTSSCRKPRRADRVDDRFGRRTGAAFAICRPG